MKDTFSRGRCDGGSSFLTDYLGLFVRRRWNFFVLIPSRDTVSIRNEREEKKSIYETKKNIMKVNESMK